VVRSVKALMFRNSGRFLLSSVMYGLSNDDLAIWRLDDQRVNMREHPDV
jgi:hypothetical protein